jgi:hypothetical protein
VLREKNSIPENTGFEIGKTGIIPVSVLTIQYQIGNTSCCECAFAYNFSCRTLLFTISAVARAHLFIMFAIACALLFTLSAVALLHMQCPVIHTLFSGFKGFIKNLGKCQQNGGRNETTIRCFTNRSGN